VKGQCYNISANRYETLNDIAEALVKEYHLKGSVKWVEPPIGDPAVQFDRMLLGFSQWVGSEKLRKDTNWRDKRMLFSEGLHVYRLAYEAHLEKGEWNGMRIQRAGEQRVLKF
jgi:hypothetical protein